MRQITQIIRNVQLLRLLTESFRYKLMTHDLYIQIKKEQKNSFLSQLNLSYSFIAT